MIASSMRSVAIGKTTDKTSAFLHFGTITSPDGYDRSLTVLFHDGHIRLDP
jgi:hypothetical protein